MTRFWLAIAPLVAIAPGCSLDTVLPDPVDAGGSGNAGGRGGSAGSMGGSVAGARSGAGGMAGTAGITGGLAGGAGASGSSAGSTPGGSGGTPSVGGSAGSSAGGALGGAGASGSGSGGKGGTGAAGASGAGAGTAGASGGSGGGKSGAVPSMGCGKGGRPSGGMAMMSNQYIFTFPESYDGDTPFPLVFGFHGAGRDNTSFRSTDADSEGTALEQNFVVAYIKSMGNDWTGQLQSNIGLFDDMVNLLESTYCIDTARVFAMGHSSGAQFISNLVCRPEPRLRAVGLVASSPYGGNCRAIPAMIIHGKNDSERGNDGSMYVMDYREQNNCSSTTMPFSSVMGCSSKQNSAAVTPGCVEYQDCGQNPLIWCSHDDPNYSGTNHGWPCFANDALFDFFSQY